MSPKGQLRVAEAMYNSARYSSHGLLSNKSSSVSMGIYATWDLPVLLNDLLCTHVPLFLRLSTFQPMGALAYLHMSPL
jgi:hypothetical protein